MIEQHGSYHGYSGTVDDFRDGIEILVRSAREHLPDAVLFSMFCFVWVLVFTSAMTLLP